MAVVRVNLSPYIDEIARVDRWRVHGVGKCCCLGFCILSGFVPVGLRIAKVYGRHVSDAEPWEKEFLRPHLPGTPVIQISLQDRAGAKNADSIQVFSAVRRDRRSPGGLFACHVEGDRGPQQLVLHPGHNTDCGGVWHPLGMDNLQASSLARH